MKFYNKLYFTLLYLEEVLSLLNIQWEKEFLNSLLHQENSLPGVCAIFAGQWNLSKKIFVVRNVPV